MTEASEERESVPFHVSVIDELKRASRYDAGRLALLLKGTLIPVEHRESVAREWRAFCSGHHLSANFAEVVAERHIMRTGEATLVDNDRCCT